MCFFGYLPCTFHHISSKLTVNAAWSSALCTGYVLKVWDQRVKGDQGRLGVKAMERARESRPKGRFVLVLIMTADVYLSKLIILCRMHGESKL